MRVDRKLFMQLLSYLFVGGVAALFEWGVFALSDGIFGLHYALSVVISFLVATLVNFLLGRRFTFRNTGIRPDKEFKLIYLVSGIGLICNLLLMTLFVTLFAWPALPSKVLCTGLVFLWNFSSRKWLVYSEGKN